MTMRLLSVELAAVGRTCLAWRLMLLFAAVAAWA